MVFMVPMEQNLWAEPLLALFLRQRHKDIMAINHTYSMISVGLSMFIMFTLPICAFVLPLLAAGDVDKRMSPGMQVATWISLIGSFYVTLLFAGWGPLASVVGERFTNYLSQDLVKNYYASVLAELIDEKSSVERRRARLGLLYERQGRVISDALKRGPNFQNICLLFFNVIWMAVGILWLVPDAAGGLTNLEHALAPHPAFRICIATILLLMMLISGSYGTLEMMSKPHLLFEEQLRAKIGPHAPRLHTALQLFGSTDQLWHFINAQNISMSLFGVPVDSALPGKIAPFVGTMVGAIAWGIARSY